MSGIGLVWGYAELRWYRLAKGPHVQLVPKIFQYYSNWHIWLLSISAGRQGYRLRIVISSMAMISAYYRQRRRNICTEHCFAKIFCQKIVGRIFQRASFPCTFCKEARFPCTLCTVDEFSVGPVFHMPSGRAQNEGKMAALIAWMIYTPSGTRIK